MSIYSAKKKSRANTIPALNSMNILRNHMDGVEELQVGFLAIGIKPLRKLNQKLTEESLSHMVISPFLTGASSREF